MSTAPTAERADLGLMQNLVADATRSDYENVVSSPETFSTSQRVSRKSLSIIVIGFCVFMLVFAAVRTQQTAPARNDERSALIERVQKRTAAVAEEELQLATQRKALIAAQSVALATSDAGRALARRVAELESRAGATALRGAGVDVIVRDSAQNAGSTGLDRVLDRDLQAVVNGLWQSGAQAIAINGLRLTSRTAIRSAGSTILVDYRPLVPPYRLIALAPASGTAADLASTFERTAGADLLRELRKQYGIEFSVNTAADLRVPAAIVSQR